MALTLSTFNCRGIQDTFKRKKIFHYLRSVKSDIIFLQETHSSIINIINLLLMLSHFGNHNGVQMPGSVVMFLTVGL